MITYDSAETFVKNMEIASVYDGDFIQLHISSPGGRVGAMEDMLDAIHLIDKPVYSYIHSSDVCDGVASAASVIVSQTHRKYIFHDAIFMIHFPEMFGIAEESTEDVLYWMQHTDVDFDTIYHMMKNNVEHNAYDAMQLGFVDEILPISYYPPIPHFDTLQKTIE